MRVRFSLIVLLTMLLSLAAQAGQVEKFGAELPHGNAVPLAQAIAAQASESTGIFSGRITDVCQKKGCWVMLEDDGNTARVLLGDHDFYVPKDVRGPAQVHGVLRRVVLPAQAREHMAAESAISRDVPEFEYRIIATGVQVEADDPGA